MTTSRHLTVTISPVTLAVGLLALLLTAGSTSYAAGLAHGSVGTAQLRNGAVTTAKLKKNSVTGDRVAPGSIATSDLAPSARAPRLVTASLRTGQGEFALASAGGVEYVGHCFTDSPLDTASLAFGAADGVDDVSIAGITSADGPSSTNALVSGPGSFYADAPVAGGQEIRSFNGTVTADGVVSQVTLTVAVHDDQPQACLFRLAVMPGS